MEGVFTDPPLAEQALEFEYAGLAPACVLSEVRLRPLSSELENAGSKLGCAGAEEHMMMAGSLSGGLPCFI